MATTTLQSVQGVPYNHLAEKFGTPLYIYDGSVILRQVANLREAFKGTDLRIKFATKALTNLSILRLLHENDVGVDTVSENEVLIAMRAGYLPHEINFTPSCVAFSEIEEGVDLGVSVNMDNLVMLEKFGRKYGNSYPCGIRLNPHIMAGGNLKISTGHVHSKFGISVDQVDEVKAIVRDHNIDVNGLHIHTGSEITGTDVFLKMASIFFAIASDFPTVRFVDFGGGFKVPYKPGDQATDMNDLGIQIGKAFKAFETSTGRKLQLWVEPGKYIVSEAGMLLVTTNVVKQTPALTFVGVNSGLNHLIRPMMYNAYHEIVNVSNPSGPLKKYTVVGNICETDTLGADRDLNEVRENDLLVIRNAGAYGYSMASNYNSRFRPAEVMVLDGVPRLIRERDTLDDLLRGQL